MPPQPIHWRTRALKARMVADWISDPEVKALLLEIAERYERIAEIAETRPFRLDANSTKS